jgi:hypothetical protein
MEEERQRSSIQQELLAEVAAGHPLSRISSEVIARSEASDDVLVLLEDGRWALVHLTWRQAPEAAPWPNVKFTIPCRLSNERSPTATNEGAYRGESAHFRTARGDDGRVGWCRVPRTAELAAARSECEAAAGRGGNRCW